MHTGAYMQAHEPGTGPEHDASTHTTRTRSRARERTRTAEQITRRGITLHRTGHGCAGPVQDPQISVKIFIYRINLN